MRQHSPVRSHAPTARYFPRSPAFRKNIPLTLYALKPRFQALLRPLVGALAAAGITANQVTVVAALGSIGVGLLVAAYSGHRLAFLLLPAWLLVRMAMNAVDGMLAREFHQKSRLGAYLNEIGDVVSDVALLLPFALISPFGFLWTGLVAILAALTEFAGILGANIGASRRYDGPLGKSDRALLFGALATWIGCGGPLWPFDPWFMPLVAALLVVTVVNRVRAGLREAAAEQRLKSERPTFVDGQ
jgi:CDP-diacylglycerol--glycerol-3-phosphate 3-phosphatidyltransferase